MNTRALKVFFIYTILLSLFVILNIIAINILKSKPLYFNVIRVYTIVEYALFAIFLNQLYKNKVAKKIVLYSIIPFVLFCILNYLSNGSKFSSYPLLTEFLAFIVFIIYFFYEKMKTEVVNPLYQSITFWICVGLFLYFTGNFFYLLFIDSTTDKIVLQQLRTIYSIVTISKNILLSLAFLANEQVESTEDSFNIPNELNLDSFNPKNNLN